jgi:hypothetical protein
VETIQCTAGLNSRPVGPVVVRQPERVVFRSVSQDFPQLGHSRRDVSMDDPTALMLAKLIVVQICLPDGLPVLGDTIVASIKVRGFRGRSASIRSPDRSNRRRLLLRGP